MNITLVASWAMVFLTAAVVQADNIETHGIDQPELVRTACMEIASLAGTFSELTVSESEATVHDDKTGSDDNGCRVGGAGDGVTYREDQWPHDILRARMTADKWREDISRSGDGAGSTAFAFRKGTALCLFAAAWSTLDPSEPETSATGWYKFEMGCFDIKEASEPAAEVGF